jgi:hypothetical protein
MSFFDENDLAPRSRQLELQRRHAEGDEELCQQLAAAQLDAALEGIRNAHLTGSQQYSHNTGMHNSGHKTAELLAQMVHEKTGLGCEVRTFECESYIEVTL